LFYLQVLGIRDGREGAFTQGNFGGMTDDHQLQ
jgi:hypothetical protein